MKKFINFKKKYFKNLYENFDINTIFETYFVHNMNKNNNWLI